VDSTNPTRSERQLYIQAARKAGFLVIGYYFQSRVEDCLRRNEQRPEDQRVPSKRFLGPAGRLEIHTLSEEFARLHAGVEGQSILPHRNGSTTLAADGSRRWLDPRLSKGRFLTRRETRDLWPREAVAKDVLCSCVVANSTQSQIRRP